MEQGKAYHLATTRRVWRANDNGAHAATWAAGYRRVPMAPGVDLDADRDAIERAALADGWPADIARNAAERAVCGDWTHTQRDDVTYTLRW